jgi:hypothetical protein
MAFDWKATLGQIAPTVATLLGGPFAGLAVGAATKALGLDNPDGSKPDNPIAAIQNALTQGQMTGEQILALKQAELEVQKHLADNGIQLEQIAANDRDSARKREVAVKDNTPKVLAYSVTIGFFGTLGLLMSSIQLSPTSHDVLLVMVGSLATAWTGIIAYYFGSSSGSKTKEETLHKALIGT